MKTLEVIRVEDWDGGDRTNFACYVSAEIPEVALKKHWPHGAFRREALIVFDSIEEVEANSRLKLMQSAWDKLTVAERVALNLLERPKK